MVTYNGDVIMGGWDETEQKLIPWALNIEVVVPPKPRRSPGRPKGSHDHPSLPEMLRAVEALYAKQERPTREKLMQQLGRAGDPRRVNEWLTPHKLNFPALCRMAKPL
jgi:hypothetical protein